MTIEEKLKRLDNLRDKLSQLESNHIHNEKLNTEPFYQGNSLSFNPKHFSVEKATKIQYAIRLAHESEIESTKKEIELLLR